MEGTLVVSLHLGEYHGSTDFYIPNLLCSWYHKSKEKSFGRESFVMWYTHEEHMIEVEMALLLLTHLCGRGLCPGATRHCPFSWPYPLNTPINGKYLSRVTVVSLPAATQLCTHTPVHVGPCEGLI